MGEKGVLCHLTSLPDTSATSLNAFLGWLKKHGFTAWQMLPITPPDQHGSPYASPSAFAGWPSLVTSEEEAPMPDDGYWLDDWALYNAIKEEQNDRPWYEWPAPLRDRHPEALEAFRHQTASHLVSQHRFQHAWNEFRGLAEQAGVELIGDLPIFVAHDSADVWAHRNLFQLDENGMPLFVAGVPPDYFSETGQKWGTVLYDWQAHRAEGWRWWKERMKRINRLFDKVRIDHFRGIHSNWAIPLEDEDATQGHWQEGPKEGLLDAIVPLAVSPTHILAEDLGIIPEEVQALRRSYGLPGMAVLHFGFGDASDQNPHHPIHITPDMVAYTGTHDNDTTLGWWSTLDGPTKERVQRLLNPGESPVEGVIRLAMESSAHQTIIPLQDLMGLGSEARMNTPGQEQNNWKWSFSWEELNRVQFPEP